MSVCKDVERGKGERKKRKKIYEFRYSETLFWLSTAAPTNKFNPLSRGLDSVVIFSLTADFSRLYNSYTYHYIFLFVSPKKRTFITEMFALRVYKLLFWRPRSGWMEQKSNPDKKMIRTQKLNKELKNLCK